MAGASAAGKHLSLPRAATRRSALGVAHVVAWPEYGGVDDRRHWHKACWNAKGPPHHEGAAVQERAPVLTGQPPYTSRLLSVRKAPPSATPVTAIMIHSGSQPVGPETGGAELS